jgi:hypothetical protein
MVTEMCAEPYTEFGGTDFSRKIAACNVCYKFSTLPIQVRKTSFVRLCFFCFSFVAMVGLSCVKRTMTVEFNNEIKVFVFFCVVSANKCSLTFNEIKLKSFFFQHP